MGGGLMGHCLIRTGCFIGGGAIRGRMETEGLELRGAFADENTVFAEKVV